MDLMGRGKPQCWVNCDNDRQNTSWLLVLAEIVISSSVARHRDYTDEAEEKREN